MPTVAAQPRTRGLIGRSLALIGSGGLLFAGFRAWTSDGVAGLDLAALDPGGAGQPSVALVLVVLAALPALAALVGDSAWPRLVAAVGASASTLAWVELAPDGALVAGPWSSLGGASLLFIAAAFATGPGVAEDPRPVDGAVGTALS